MTTDPICPVCGGKHQGSNLPCPAPFDKLDARGQHMRKLQGMEDVLKYTLEGVRASEANLRKRLSMLRQAVFMTQELDNLAAIKTILAEAMKRDHALSPTAYSAPGDPSSAESHEA